MVENGEGRRETRRPATETVALPPTTPDGPAIPPKTAKNHFTILKGLHLNTLGKYTTLTGLMGWPVR